MKPKKPLKIRVPRTRNSGTMTESMFWGGIRSALRQKSRWWKPMADAKLKARVKYIGPNKRRKWAYVCANCKGTFLESEIHIDHIIPAGTLRKSEDLPGFVDRLFCEVDGFQILCETCHHKKTQYERKIKGM